MKEGYKSQKEQSVHPNTKSYVRQSVSKSDVRLSCLYVNARSICNKMDSLLVMVESFQPHIIAVTESWGNAEIDDSELYITGYTMFRKDRPLDARGGGVLLFVSEDLGAVEWLPSTKFPEQTWCRLCINNDMELLVGRCLLRLAQQEFVP